MTTGQIPWRQTRDFMFKRPETTTLTFEHQISLSERLHWIWMDSLEVKVSFTFDLWPRKSNLFILDSKPNVFNLICRNSLEEILRHLVHKTYDLRSILSPAAGRPRHGHVIKRKSWLFAAPPHISTFLFIHFMESSALNKLGYSCKNDAFSDIKLREVHLWVLSALDLKLSP